ncbi:MAG: tyrosine-type recombinase/integrase [Spirochaetes bacterium]|nr:tyrosine-type recombinase/integrase [Spirochaetota bacterium]
MERFWSYDESPYIREKLAHEHRLGRRHAYDMLLHVRTHWKPYFTSRRLAEIGRADLQNFSLWLKETKGLKGKTVNNVLAAGTVGLRWAQGNALIPTNPAEGLMQFSGKAARRGVLAEEEVERLFAKPWPDERAWLGNALALSTGLRQGEVLAVQVRVIADDRLHVRHAWSNLDGLKAPKTGEERTVPLVPGLRAALLDLARKNPHGVGPALFVFWSVERADRPMDAHGLLDPLKAALLRLTLTDDDAKDPEKVPQAETYWRSRRVCFHSWRHLYAARMADRLEARKVMSATGHKSGAVFEVYADHASEKVFLEVSAAAADTFGKLITFPGAGVSA